MNISAKGFDKVKGLLPDPEKEEGRMKLDQMSASYPIDFSSYCNNNLVSDAAVPLDQSLSAVAADKRLELLVANLGIG